MRRELYLRGHSPTSLDASTPPLQGEVELWGCLFLGLSLADEQQRHWQLKVPQYPVPG
ncbi:MAG TPA: hypothetical protein V6D03_01450 [Candidatus Caenarcaniphilales bacterium]